MTRTILMLAACAAMARAEEYAGTIMMHNGSTLLPNMAVPTPAEVSGTKTAADSAAGSAAALRAQADVLGARALSLETSVSALDGSAIVYGSCVAFGSVSVEAATNATARVLGFNFPSNTAETVYVDIYTWFSEPPAETPAVEHSATLPDDESGAWSELSALGTVLTTYEAGGVEYECYRSSVGVPAANLSGFFRIRGEAQQTVIGQVLVIYHDMTINGVSGLSTNVAGIGQFMRGLLVEPLEGGE